MLYTRKGDDGTSGLFGTKERIPKDDPVFEALGSLDELNSFLGVCYARARTMNETLTCDAVRNVQEALFVLQAELAGAQKNIGQSHLEALEQKIDYVESTFINPHGFVLSGSTELSALLDYARALVRKAERAVVKAGHERSSRNSRAYLNRLSSFLYALARHAASHEGLPEASPSYTV